jgi:single-strand DNA-binding protein
MFSLNRVQIIGYQTQPVTIRQTPSGTSVTDLNIVAPYSFRSDAGEMLTGKGFHVVTLWGPMAEVAGRFVHAGSQLFLSGSLQTDSWEDEKTSEKRSKTKIVARDMIILDPKEGGLKELPSSASSLGCSMNRADVIGNVTRDPELRTTTGGQQVLSLGVATNDRWKDKATGEMKEKTEFHQVVIWGKTAEQVALSVKKGSKVYVSGRVQTRSFEAKDGAKRYTTEVVADAVQLLGMRHPLADSSIQPDGAPRAASFERGASERSESASSAGGDIQVPEIAYASEIKVEDLPF